MGMWVGECGGWVGGRVGVAFLMSEVPPAHRGVAERLTGVGLEPSVQRAAYGITAVKSL